MSDLDHVRTLQLVQQRKQECLNSAVLDGLTSAGISLAVAGGLSWSLQRSSPVSGGGVTQDPPGVGGVRGARCSDCLAAAEAIETVIA